MNVFIKNITPIYAEMYCAIRIFFKNLAMVSLLSLYSQCSKNVSKYDIWKVLKIGLNTRRIWKTFL